ncbi:tagaturonate reductase [Paenibacillus lemnae]|uniref:Tagaturonate reductase n=1 Tax=Paenibacillus lemnae TaxID=1330551 RepID=A0A848M8K2_PAELE|nr:tagaturonate reductase [Paenibacillus lemnae]NMO96223.1 tagaturonate reductase [Paenibacillus lemnae]
MVNKQENNTLSIGMLDSKQTAETEKIRQRPIKILQFGEGNFLRGFVDWMIQKSADQGLYDGTVVVTQPRPSGRKKLEQLAQQDGLYTLLTRGIHGGSTVEDQELISVISRTIDPYEEWESYLSLADEPQLDVILSNTTEAGLSYTFTEYQPDQPMLSYPAKLTLLLYRRFKTFNGAADKGLMLLPCELLERNGDSLRDIVLTHAKDWKLEESFSEWLQHHNLFLNSLVDRIVTGYPSDAEEWAQKLGYKDSMLNTAEPYHLWVIEGSPELDQRLPLQSAGLNVHWVDDLKPYQLRKVRILNGTHTLMASIGLVHGSRFVRETAEHPELGQKARLAMRKELVPSVPLPLDEMNTYADEVWERFLNPFVEHRLGDICLNSISKFKVRLLPSLKSYVEIFGKLPAVLTESLACLIYLYDTSEQNGEWIGRTLQSSQVVIRDEAAAVNYINDTWLRLKNGSINRMEFTESILSNEALWGENLNNIAGLCEAVCTHLEELELKAL